MKLNKWLAMPLIAVVLPAIVAFGSKGTSNQDKSGTDWGSLPIVIQSDEGGAILAECAKTECVRAKADELAAQTQVAANAASTAGSQTDQQVTSSSYGNCDSACQYQKEKAAAAASLLAETQAQFETRSAADRKAMQRLSSP